MKKTILRLLLICLCCFFSACEKDDICVDGNTPLLVIGFFDAAAEDTDTFKAVPNLRVKFIEADNDQVLNDRNSYGFADRATVNDSIFIPLRIANTNTVFEFIINSADGADTMMETGNKDSLTFTYEVGEQFISRACGFVANYDNLTADRTTDTENWILNVVTEETTIENSTAIHVKIFH